VSIYKCKFEDSVPLLIASDWFDDEQELFWEPAAAGQTGKDEYDEGHPEQSADKTAATGTASLPTRYLGPASLPLSTSPASSPMQHPNRCGTEHGIAGSLNFNTPCTTMWSERGATFKEGASAHQLITGAGPVYSRMRRTPSKPSLLGLSRSNVL
jgi:hypothetical protein